MKKLWRIARNSILLWFGAAFFSVGLMIFLIGSKGLIEERGYQGESRFITAGESSVVAIVLGSLFAIVGGFFFVRSVAQLWNQWSILCKGDARAEISALTHDVASPAQIEPRQSFWRQLKGFLTMLALAFAVIITGEIVMPITGLDGFIADHETLFLSTAIGATAVGFVLFMGGILYRIFGGKRAPMSRADVEDHLRSVAFKTQPYLVRASMYRFKGKSTGSSFHDQYSIKEAKEAWKQRAWRTSLRWRGNFVIMGGVLLFATGLFSIFVVTGANGIRFLCGAAILYALIRTFVAFRRA